MRKLTRKEELQLGKELRVAKIKVLYRWGFSDEEISNIMELPVSVIKNIKDKLEESE